MSIEKPRAKRGPKPKPADQKLRNEIRIYVSDLLYQKLTQAALAADTSISDFVRKNIEDAFPREPQALWMAKAMAAMAPAQQRIQEAVMTLLDNEDDRNEARGLVEATLSECYRRMDSVPDAVQYTRKALAGWGWL